MPALSSDPIRGVHYSMIGLGDLAFPGLVVCYVLRFDYTVGRAGAGGYFPLALGGYLIGLIFTDIALVSMQRGQVTACRTRCLVCVGAHVSAVRAARAHVPRSVRSGHRDCDVAVPP
jgi:hypothetical protein